MGLDSPVVLGLAALCLWGLAGGVRLRLLDHCAVGSDSLGPYLQAISASWSHLPRPPNPESGDALWWMAWPLIRLADSLEVLFALRLILAGVVAPLAFFGAWTGLGRAGLTVQARWGASLAAGLLLALDPGLLDTALSGARGYAAPELIGLATLGLVAALQGVRWGLGLALAGTVLAMDHHALAAGVWVGWLAIAPTLWRAMERRQWIISGGLVFVLGLPRLIRTVELADCGEGLLVCLSGVSGSNVDPTASTAGELWTAVRDRAWVDLDWVWPALAMGVGLAVVDWGRRASRDRRGHVGRPQRVLAIWALGSLAGVLLVGAAIGYLRSYHLRILAIPLGVVAALGWARWWPASLALGALCGGLWGLWTPLAPAEDLVAPTDQVAAELGSQAPPIWVDRVWWEGDPCIDPAGVVLSAVLGGQPADDFQLDPRAHFVLIECGEVVFEGPPAWPVGADWRVRHFQGSADAAAWVDGQGLQPIEREGAWDWAKVLHPKSVRLEQKEWSGP